MASNETGAFVPLTNIWDPETINKPENSPESKELKLRLYQNVSNISQVINNKVTGFYDTSEFVTGATFFANPNPIAGQPPDRRQVYRKVINFGTLPAAGATVTVAHGIAVNSGFTLVSLFGAATDPVALEAIPLPYVSGSAPTTSVGLYLTATNIIARSSPAKAWDMFTKSYIIIEYLKQ